MGVINLSPNFVVGIGELGVKLVLIFQLDFKDPWRTRSLGKGTQLTWWLIIIVCFVINGGMFWLRTVGSQTMTIPCAGVGEGWVWRHALPWSELPFCEVGVEKSEIPQILSDLVFQWEKREFRQTIDAWGFKALYDFQSSRLSLYFFPWIQVNEALFYLS